MLSDGAPPKMPSVGNVPTTIPIPIAAASRVRAPMRNRTSRPGSADSASSAGTSATLPTPSPSAQTRQESMKGTAGYSRMTANAPMNPATIGATTTAMPTNARHSRRPSSAGRARVTARMAAAATTISSELANM